MTRAPTSGELVKLRSDGQWSRPAMAFLKPAVVFSARVDMATIVADGLAEIVYDGATGDYTHVVPGMTLFVGSSAGAYDKGRCRVRKAATSAKLFVGWGSEIDLADNDYLTVVREFDLWAKNPRTFATVDYMDYEETYDAQHDAPAPIPRLGMDKALKLAGLTVSHSRDASESAVPDGGSITAYAWTAAGASASSGMDTATPTITYNVAGWHLESCTLTADNGESATGYRWTYVHSSAAPPVMNFKFGSRIRGEVDTGVWSVKVEMLDEAALDDVYDGARVILFTEDYYGGVPGSLGPLTGHENMALQGWVDGESIVRDPTRPACTFTVYGPAWRLGRITGSAVTLNDVSGTADKWTEMPGLTVDLYLWHLLHHRSTCTAVMDVFLPGDTRRAKSLTAPSAPLWEQIRLADTKVNARAVCDCYGRLIIETDAQVLPLASRSGIPVVRTLAEQDWVGEIEFERVTLPPVARLETNADVWDGTTSALLLSASHGQVQRRFGQLKVRDRLLAASQADLNAVTGLLMGRENNPFPRISIALASNDHFIDTGPRQYLELEMDTSDTPRAFTCGGRRLLPRVVEREFSEKTGKLRTFVQCEAETFQETAVTVERPETPVDNYPPQPEPLDPPLFPSPFPPGYPDGPILPPEDPDPPADECRTDNDWPANGPHGLFLAGVLSSSRTPPYWYNTKASFIRASTATHKTTIEIHGCFEEYDGDAAEWVPSLTTDWIDVYAVNGSGRIATATAEAVTDDGCGTRRWVFEPIVGVDVLAYVIEVDSTPVWVRYCDANDVNAPATGATEMTHVSGVSGEVNNLIAEFEVDFWLRRTDAMNKSMFRYFGIVTPKSTFRWTCAYASLVFDDDTTLTLSTPHFYSNDLGYTPLTLVPGPLGGGPRHVKAIRHYLVGNPERAEVAWEGFLELWNICGPPSGEWRIRAEQIVLYNICAYGVGT